MRKYAPYHETQRPFIRRVAGPLCLMFIMFYLGFHAISGERGLIALFTESHRLEGLKVELAAMTKQRELLESKVQRLSDKSLDLDLLDEQVRRVLGMAHKNEVVYFISENPAPQK
jgi:cell division protein FtsB